MAGRHYSEEMRKLRLEVANESSRIALPGSSRVGSKSRSPQLGVISHLLTRVPCPSSCQSPPTLLALYRDGCSHPSHSSMSLGNVTWPPLSSRSALESGLGHVNYFAQQTKQTSCVAAYEPRLPRSPSGNSEIRSPGQPP